MAFCAGGTRKGATSNNEDRSLIDDLEQKLLRTEMMLAKSQQETAAASTALDESKAEVAVLRQMLQAAGQEASHLRSNISEPHGLPPPMRPQSSQEMTIREPNAADTGRLLEHLKSDTYVRLGPSTIAGVGVFAIRPIACGANPLLICNEHLSGCQKFVALTTADLRSIPASVMELVRSFSANRMHEEDAEQRAEEDGTFVYYVSPNGTNANAIASYLNHSDLPNVAFRKPKTSARSSRTLHNGGGGGAPTQTAACFVTLRALKEGEELTLDYRELGTEYYSLVGGPRPITLL